MRTSQSFLCFPIVLFMLSMLRRAYISLLNELMSEREDVYLSVCVTLLWWYFQVGVAIPRLCCFISPWTMTVKNIVSLSVFHLNQPVWSLGEGQAPEELDKPIETPPLSTLLIEKPQSATVSVGELTIKRIRSTNRCPWLQAANWSTSRCIQLLPQDKTVPSATCNEGKEIAITVYPHLDLCAVQKRLDFITSYSNRRADLSISTPFLTTIHTFQYSAAKSHLIWGVLLLKVETPASLPKWRPRISSANPPSSGLKENGWIWPARLENTCSSKKHLTDSQR